MAASLREGANGTLIYSEVVERIIQGVQRVKPDASHARLTMQIDAAFPQIDNEVSEAFAADEDKRPQLGRVFASVSFTAGEAALPAGVLGNYLKDASLTITFNGSLTRMDYVWPYTDFSRNREPRLGCWAVNGSTIYAKTPSPVANYTGTGILVAIASPDIPTSAGATYVAPADYVSELIEAFIEYLLGKTEEAAAGDE